METLPSERDELTSIDEDILKKREEYEELDLKYRELLTKYAILDNIDELVNKKSELFKELQSLEEELNRVKIKISKKEEEMMHYDATKLVIGIVEYYGEYSIHIYTYLRSTYFWDTWANNYRNCKIYKDIECSSDLLGIDDQNKKVADKTNVNVIDFIKYLDLVKLIDPKLAKEKSVTLKDIEEALSVLANYDLSKVNMEEIVYSLKAIQRDKKRKRRLK